jgi:septation ring formation regulator EzrA
MNYIDEMIDKVEEEIGGAVDYAEESIKCRAKGHTDRANRYKSMAMDELTHAETIRNFATQDIEEIKRVYSIPVEDEEKWHKAHRKFNELIGAIKLMLN